MDFSKSIPKSQHHVMTYRGQWVSINGCLLPESMESLSACHAIMRLGFVSLPLGSTLVGSQFPWNLIVQFSFARYLSTLWP